MEEKQRTCKNCRYFLQHYAKGNTYSTYFHRVCCGHCVCSDLTEKERKGVPYVNNCRGWEPVAIQKIERLKSIVSVLRSMEEHLEQIALVLKDDYCE